MFQIPDDCTGCYGCANICPAKCISMKEKEGGFLYPVVNPSSCVNCGQCEKVCPVLHIPEISTHSEALAIKNKNQEIRQRSTSGGFFPLLAERVLEKGGIVFGAEYDEKFQVRHISITDKRELQKLQGAKYVQSVLGECLTEVKQELERERLVLFSGTPCQCAGLQSFLGEKYSNLIMVDLVCHGVPAPKVWEAYIAYRSKKENKGILPEKINMRSKITGWSHYGYSTEFDYGGGMISYVPNSRDLFMRAFIGNICLRRSCGACEFKGIERCTDFTLGDYWGIWNQAPDFDDDKGTSVVFVHSDKGKQILDILKPDCEVLEVKMDAAYQENISMISSSEAHTGREEFLQSINKMSFEEQVKKFFPPATPKNIGLLQKIKGKINVILNFKQ